MRIWHLDTVGSAQTVDGVAVGLWHLAGAQALDGHDVTIVVRTPPDDSAHAVMERTGVHAVAWTRAELARRARETWSSQGAVPDVVHFHATWIPAHARIAAWLRRSGVPYVLTPHGGYAPAVRASKRWRRDAYVATVERPYVRGAAAIVLNLDAEADQVTALAGGVPGLMRTVRFPTDVAREGSWSPDAEVPTVVFLGRFSPFQKGLDRLVEIAWHRPELRFELYGSTPDDALLAMASLRAGAPANVRMLPPIHGDELDARLRTATAYVQPGRFDGFPLSVVDALSRGLPCLLSRDLAVAHELAAHDAAGTLDADPVRAAAELRAQLDDVSTLRRWSVNGVAFARDQFDPAGAARRHADVYREAIADAAAARPAEAAAPMTAMTEGRTR